MRLLCNPLLLSSILLVICFGLALYEHRSGRAAKEELRLLQAQMDAEIDAAQIEALRLVEERGVPAPEELAVFGPLEFEKRTVRPWARGYFPGYQTVTTTIGEARPDPDKTLMERWLLECPTFQADRAVDVQLVDDAVLFMGPKDDEVWISECDGDWVLTVGGVTSDVDPDNRILFLVWGLDDYAPDAR